MAGKTVGPDKMVTPAEMKKRSEKYFDECKAAGRKPNLAGAALAMGFASRQSLYDYRDDPLYAEALGKVMLQYEDALLDGTLNGDIPPAAGIFCMKNINNRQGYSDKQELDHTSSDGSMSPNKSIEEIDNKLREYGIDPDNV